MEWDGNWGYPACKVYGADGEIWWRMEGNLRSRIGREVWGLEGFVCRRTLDGYGIGDIAKGEREGGS